SRHSGYQELLNWNCSPVYCLFLQTANSAGYGKGYPQGGKQIIPDNAEEVSARATDTCPLKSRIGLL
ncbi:MAG: hypothetical protein MJ196_04275, partial [Treponemataceae bacterium]|nr:hypothetical protein [Treponemataceae bacterium]